MRTAATPPRSPSHEQTSIDPRRGHRRDGLLFAPPRPDGPLRQLHHLADAANAARLETDHGVSLLPRVEAGPDSHDAQQGKDVVFSEPNLYSMARTERYKMTIDSLTRQRLALYDIENDPDQLRNLVDERRLSEVRVRFLEDYFSQLLAELNEPQLKVSRTAASRPNFTRNTLSTECVTSSQY